jgi:ATP-binding cassette subfamily B protein
MASYADSESLFIDTLSGIETMKSFGTEPFNQAVTSAKYSNFQEKTLQLGRVSISFNLFVELFGSAFIVALLGRATYSVFAGSVSSGSLIAILQMVTILMASATNIAITNIQLQEAKVAFERMYEFASLQPDNLDAKTTMDAGPTVLSFRKLELSNIGFRHIGTPSLLNNVNLVLERGDWVSIIGEVFYEHSSSLFWIESLFFRRIGTGK